MIDGKAIEFAELIPFEAGADLNRTRPLQVWVGSDSVESGVAVRRGVWEPGARVRSRSASGTYSTNATKKPSAAGGTG